MYVPTHLFLVNGYPADLSTPALPGLPTPPHQVRVAVYALDYSQGLDGGLQDSPVLAVSARALVTSHRSRVLPWTAAKRHVLPYLEDLYATPEWSINWATSHQAQGGRGKWAAHGEVLDHLADWSRDYALDRLDAIAEYAPEGAMAAGTWTRQVLADYLGGDLAVGQSLDADLADSGQDRRNLVGLGAFTTEPTRPAPSPARPSLANVASTVYWDRWDTAKAVR